MNRPRKNPAGASPPPPHDTESERSLVGAMMYSSAAITAAKAICSPDDFYVPETRRIAEAIWGLAEAGEAVDVTTVHARVGDIDLPRLTEMVSDVPTSGHASTYAKAIADCATRRGLIALGREAREMGNTLTLDIASGLERTRVLLEHLDGRTPAEAEVPWPTLADEGWHGPFGEYALLAVAYTEADPVGILVSCLAAFGVLVGPSPHMNVGNVRHGINLGVVLVGESAKSRKGSAFAAANRVLREADPDFRKARVLGGFNSGEAIADAFRAPDGVRPDARLLCLEPEFGRFLAAGNREGSTMTAMARNAWDGQPLEARARATTTVVDEHHLAVVAQTTVEELRAKLKGDDLFNGFANRFLWVAVRRGGLQPNGGNVPDYAITEAAGAMAKLAHNARRRSLLTRTAGGEARWEEVYREIAVDDPGGPLGGATSRGDVQTLRLSMLYALADDATQISETHVDAAYALWRYCRSSAAWIWADGAGPAQRILAALTTHHPHGMNRRALHALFGNNIPATELDGMLKNLAATGRVRSHTVSTGGRPAEVWTLNQ